MPVFGPDQFGIFAALGLDCHVCKPSHRAERRSFRVFELSCRVISPSGAMPNSKKGKKSKQKVNGGHPGRSFGVPPTARLLPSDFKQMNFAYVGQGVLTEAAAATGTHYTWRLNSLYDPDFTGVGSTVMGWTQISAAYGLFRVLAVRVIVHFYNASAAQSTVGLLPGLNSTYTSDYLRWEAEPNCSSTMIQGNTGGARSMAVFDRTYDLPKIAGLSRKQYMTDMDFTHSTGANPARGLFVSCYMRGMSGTAQSVGYVIRLIYRTEVSQPLQTLTT